MIYSGLELEYTAFPMPPSYIKQPCKTPPPTPPSRAGVADHRRAAGFNDDDDGLQEMLQTVSHKLTQVFEKQTESERRAARSQNTGRRRATVSQEERLKKTQPLNAYDQRSMSLELHTSIEKQIPRKPVPLRPKRSPSGRPLGLRRPLLKLNDSFADVSDHSPCRGKPSSKVPHRSASVEGTFKHLQVPPVLPLSPPISPMAVCFESRSPSYTSTDESDATVTSHTKSDDLSDRTVKMSSSDTALEDYWNWDDTVHSADAEDQYPAGPPSAPISRPRKPSSRNILRRPQTASGIDSTAQEPMQHHLGGAGTFLNGHEPRSEMVWDSSDDEDTFGKKLRVSFGKNSLKKSKIANILRRNSGD